MSSVETNFSPITMFGSRGFDSVVRLTNVSGLDLDSSHANYTVWVELSELWVKIDWITYGIGK